VCAARPDQNGWLAANKISGEFRKAIDVLIRPPIFDRDVLTINKSSLIQALRERGNEMRREFIAGVGGAVAWPRVVRAQQQTPLVGFLNGQTAAGFTHASFDHLVGARK
jgi:hypothetical protein